MSRDCVVVTGASRGIGAAIALALARQGLHVACLSRSGDLPACPSADAVEASGRWIPLQADVTDGAAMGRALRRLADEGWRIVGLVNNAGVHRDARSSELEVQEWHHIMDTNATAVVTACQAAYPHLVQAGGGMIVNIGSFFDKLGVKRNLAYCASKAAVGAITRVLAVEWADAGIRAVDVAPGYIVTELNADAMAEGGPLRAYLEKRIPGRQPGTAHDVAAVVGALYTPAGRFLTGETIYVDGAQSVAH